MTINNPTPILLPDLTKNALDGSAYLTDHVFSIEGFSVHSAFFPLVADWPDYESDSDESQVEAIINVSADAPDQPSNQTSETATPMLDLSLDFRDGDER